MYLELFLLDNLLMNLLIVRLAAALLSARPPLLRQLGAAFLSAASAALAAYLFPWLRRAAFRLPMLAVMALAIPVSSPRGFLTAAAATLFATFAVGGCALALAYMTGGGALDGVLAGGIGMRTALVSAAAASFLPRAARRILRRRQKNLGSARLVVVHGGIARRFNALVDTGNSLCEPVTGLPVAVVRCRALERFADIPIRVSTAAGGATLMAFRPERISVDGREVDCMVALTRAGLSEEALIPPDITHAEEGICSKGF